MLRAARVVVWCVSLALVALTQPGCAKQQKITAAAIGLDPSEVRLLALGDSFTIGTGSGPQAAFPARLTTRLTEAGARVTLRNLAVNGFTTQDLISQELPQVRAFRPTLITLAIGANDIVQGSTEDAYRRQVRRILDELNSLGLPADHILTLPQPDWPHSRAVALFGDPEVLDRKARAFNRILQEEATRIGARYVDLSPLMRRQASAELFAPDGLHPAAQAHDEWGAALFQELSARPPSSPATTGEAQTGKAGVLSCGHGLAAAQPELPDAGGTAGRGGGAARGSWR